MCFLFNDSTRPNWEFLPRCIKVYVGVVLMLRLSVTGARAFSVFSALFCLFVTIITFYNTFTRKRQNFCNDSLES